MITTTCSHKAIPSIKHRVPPLFLPYSLNKNQRPLQKVSQQLQNKLCSFGAYSLHGKNPSNKCYRLNRAEGVALWTKLPSLILKTPNQKKSKKRSFFSPNSITPSIKSATGVIRNALNSLKRIRTYKRSRFRCGSQLITKAPS